MRPVTIQVTAQTHRLTGNFAGHTCPMLRFLTSRLLTFSTQENDLRTKQTTKVQIGNPTGLTGP